jgi:methionyl aminopeptidase
VNEVACHGIPDDRALEAGDIISLDLTVWLDGVHGDTCLTVPVGAVDGESARLMLATDESLAAGIAAVRPGAQMREIGAATERVAHQRGFRIVRMFTGHGIGTGFHPAPTVLHFDDPNEVAELEVGMTFTIEPILTTGSAEIAIWRDGWTAVTTDGGRCAQAEHTVVVTEDGAEILTRA